MTTLLHVSASPRGAFSDSLKIANCFLAEHQVHHPATVVDTLDLFDGNLPAFGRHAAEAKLAHLHGQPLTEEQAEEWATARRVFQRFADADLYLFNIPMWNNGIPYVLKQWIDIISQPGWTFSIDENGYAGLIHDKRAIVVYTSGTFSPTRGPAFGNDFQSTYFRDWLNLIGVIDISEIRLQPTIYSPTYEQDHLRAIEQGSNPRRVFVARSPEDPPHRCLDHDILRSTDAFTTCDQRITPLRKASATLFSGIPPTWLTSPVPASPTYASPSPTSHDRRSSTTRCSDGR